MQRHAVAKCGHGQGRDGCLCTACHHGIGITVQNAAVGLADGVVACGAGGDNGDGSPLEVVLDGDKAAGHVDNHAGHEEGGHPPGALLHEGFLLLGKGVHAANAGAKVGADALGGQGALDAALLHRLGGCGHGVLAEHVKLAHIGFLHVLQGVEVLHLGGHLGLVLRGVKVGDGPNAALARFQALPKGGHVVAHGGDAPQAGYHNSSHIARPPSTRMVSPVM